MAKERGILVDRTANDLKIDVVRDSSGKIAQGLLLGDVTEQNTMLILKGQPGEFKEHLTVGIGIDNMLLDHDYLLYKHKIRQQLGADGMQIKYLEINKQDIEINAKYK